MVEKAVKSLAKPNVDDDEEEDDYATVVSTGMGLAQSTEGNQTVTKSKIKLIQQLELYDGKRLIVNDSKINFYELYNQSKDLFIARATKN